MYGALDLAEAIRLGTADQLPESDHAPHIERRGIKFNIPLDVRNPSYSDNSDAAQNNIPEMWSMDFWRDALDELARHRFNVLTLWSLHPFPSLVKVPEFPEVALDDVLRTRRPFNDRFSHNGRDMFQPAMLEEVEIVRTMSIDQKIQFWRDVMQHAHDRGIEVYWFTWNIFTHGVLDQYGINTAQDNPVTLQYFRASVREMVLSYPLLAGIGITAGEQMRDRDDEFSKEKWLWKSYGEGVRDALQLQPNRPFRLIHRFHQTGLGIITNEWSAFPGQFDVSFKYAIAHMYSIPDPPYIQAALPHLSPDLRTWLTVRNDDVYSFRWGDPDFARAFIQAIPGPDKIVGYYMGPDGFTWGRDFLTRKPDTPRPTIFQKQWYSFLLWGRLSYDPNLSNDRFRRIIGSRFPQTDSRLLFEAWAHASRVFPWITRWFWRHFDFHWLPEACVSHPEYRGWYTVRHFIEGSTMPGSDLMNIVDWRAQVLAEQPPETGTPLHVADELIENASLALQRLQVLQSELRAPSPELRATLTDIEAMSHLGLYYGWKIRGACSLALFDATGQSEHQETAIQHLETAVTHWRNYSRAYIRQYRQPILYNRVGWVDIPAFITHTLADVKMARDWKPGSIQDDKIQRGHGGRPFRE
jgi:hypothetical protein